MSEWIRTSEVKEPGVYIDTDGRLCVFDRRRWFKVMTQTKKISTNPPAGRLLKLSWEFLDNMRNNLREQIKKEGIC